MHGKSIDRIMSITKMFRNLTAQVSDSKPYSENSCLWILNNAIVWLSKRETELNGLFKTAF